MIYLSIYIYIYLFVIRDNKNRYACLYVFINCLPFLNNLNKIQYNEFIHTKLNLTDYFIVKTLKKGNFDLVHQSYILILSYVFSNFCTFL